MQDSNQEIIRRILSNVLTRLERPTSSSVVQASASEGGPIIIVVLGNGEPARESVERNSTQVFNEGHRQLEAPEKKIIQTQAAHPELERFASLEVQQNNFAPKTCFMEPDRVCVNSGACEMRGY
jgi:hypothetical protein